MVLVYLAIIITLIIVLIPVIQSLLLLTMAVPFVPVMVVKGLSQSKSKALTKSIKAPKLTDKEKYTYAENERRYVQMVQFMSHGGTL